MSIFEAVQRPELLHAMVVHFPVVLAVLGVPLAAITAVLSRKRLLLWVTVGFFAALTLIAWAAMLTGEKAREAAPASLTAEVWPRIEAHEAAAEKVWVASAVTALLALLTLIPRARMQQVIRGMMVLAAFTTAGVVGITGHRGAMLVYQYGVGTKALALSAVPASGAAPEASPLTAADAAAPERDQAQPWRLLSESSYQERVWPIIERHCLDCHSGEKPKAGLDVSTLEGLSRGGRKAGATVTPGDPGGSVLIQYLEGTLQPQMPYRDAPLSAEEIGVVREWISGTAAASP